MHGRLRRNPQAPAKTIENRPNQIVFGLAFGRMFRGRKGFENRLQVASQRIKLRIVERRPFGKLELAPVV